MRTFIVFGCGRFGSTVAKRLYELGNEVVACDINPEKVDNIAPHVTDAIVCDVEDENALNELGLSNYEVAVVGIAENLVAAVMAVLAAKEAGIGKVIAKAPSTRAAKILLKVGADRIVYPEMDIGHRLADNLSNKNLIDSYEFSNGYKIFDMEAPEYMIGKKISDLNLKKDYGLLILMINRHHDTFVNPMAKFEFEKGDIVTFLGTDEMMKEMTQEV